MIDFKKRLAGARVGKPASPIELYETLDRRHDKGPLRPAQEAVLKEWYEKRADARDVIVKLHTGQGKTLVGLLMLQSRLNQGFGPVVYLCPDHFLIDQTRQQAKQFGISTCEADPELPEEFLNSEKILVTSVQKLFNGLTKFGLGNKALKIDTVLMDDAHACADIIRESCRIRIEKDDAAYHALLSLFSSELEQQGQGTFADIENDDPGSFLPVPYWAWNAKSSDVAGILSKATEKKSVKFAWPLLRNSIENCLCVISGQAMEIEPYLAPLHLFGTYATAKHRIFMSATVTDDSFLVKGLNISVDAITDPLTYAKERWSGEKMVLIPSLLHEELSRSVMVQEFGTPNARNKAGVVSLAPGFSWTKDWERYGSIVANKETLAACVERLQRGEYGLPVVMVNRYHGVDLPDDDCRVLIFDSRPYSASLIDEYEEASRSGSIITLMRAVRTVEQGMGRSVRGEKDYSVIVVIGADLTRLVRDKKSRDLLSSQMATQIEIGLDIAEMAQEEIQKGVEPIVALKGLIAQCLGRDEGWKAFYAEGMKGVVPKGANKQVLEIYAKEAAAELAFSDGEFKKAKTLIQTLIDSSELSVDEKGWYLQMMARFAHPHDKIESQSLQLSAFKCNRLLLKPPSGVSVTQLKGLGEKRAERILDWMSQYEGYQQLDVALTDVLSKLAFGTKADHFEQGIDELAQVLGLIGERPDKEWKDGPDNLWALDKSQYLLWECKNEVDLKRTEINKREAEQMNRSSAWFEKHYSGMKVKRIMVHPASKEAHGAFFLHEVDVMTQKELSKLLKNVRAFFKSFEGADFADISPALLERRLVANNLMTSDLISLYGKKVKSPL